MQPERLKDLLADVAAGAVTTDEAIRQLADLPFAEVLDEAGGGVARVDHHRELRLGFPETIFCQGKTPEQVVSIAAEMLRNGPVVLATRAGDEHWEALVAAAPDAERSQAAGVMWVDRRPVRPSSGHVVVVTGGTADLPVAEEAAVCAEIMGNRVSRVFDVGVAGVHRLLANRERLAGARVIIAVAGMEGALPSLVAGLVGAPVVAVPTSVGYGASFGGISALLTMLTSCAPGIGVVNIDNGFGAAALASRINQLGAAEEIGGVPDATGDPRSAVVIGWLDASSGVSGDKLLGALLDAGVDIGVMRDALEAVLPGEGVVTGEAVTRRGIAGVHVVIAETRAQPARSWKEIRELIEASALDVAVRDRAIAVFEALACAEAAVHGVSVDQVHFHEVGAVDSIADIVGACAGLAALGVEEFVCSPIALGSGFVTAAHGVLPVPAPATARLLVGAPVVAGESTGELTTPTGAALVSVLADRYGPMPPMTIVAVGHGAGTRETETANVARVVIGDAAPLAAPASRKADDSGLERDRVVVLRAVVDHVSAEHLAFALERMLEAGARDAWITPVVMKKGRPGGELTVLADVSEGARLAAELVRHTGTLGVRAEETDRYVATRREEVVDTAFGPVRVKVGPGETVRPEHDDCARIARERDLTVREVEAEVRRALGVG